MNPVTETWPSVLQALANPLSESEKNYVACVHLLSQHPIAKTWMPRLGAFMELSLYKELPAQTVPVLRLRQTDAGVMAVLWWPETETTEVIPISVAEALATLERVVQRVESA
jgi:hypothetical protein